MPVAVSEKRIYRLVHDQARRLAADFCISAPEGWIARFSEPTRTLDQNAMLHAALTDIARQIDWHGNRLDVEDWKRLMTAAWMRAEKQPVTLVPAIDGSGFDVLYRRTSRMSKSEVSSLIEYLHAWGADRGVKWTA